MRTRWCRKDHCQNRRSWNWQVVFRFRKSHFSFLPPRAFFRSYVDRASLYRRHSNTSIPLSRSHFGCEMGLYVELWSVALLSSKARSMSFGGWSRTTQRRRLAEAVNVVRRTIHSAPRLLRDLESGLYIWIKARDAMKSVDESVTDAEVEQEHTRHTDQPHQAPLGRRTGTHDSNCQSIEYHQHSDTISNSPPKPSNKNCPSSSQRAYAEMRTFLDREPGSRCWR